MVKSEVLDDIALALQQNFMEGANYYDKTDDRVVLLGDELFDEDADLEDFPDWQKDSITIARTHELILIEPVMSYESFNIMKAFADQQDSEKIKASLYNALSLKHPFSKFRFAVENNGVLQEWYSFKNARYRELAQEWLEENHLPF